MNDVRDYAALGPDWRITLRNGEWVLESQDPAMRHWHETDGPGSWCYCIYAYERRCDGETPLNFDDWQMKQEQSK